VRLPDGGTLVACGDLGGRPGRVFEVSAQGHVRWSVQGDDLPGISLRFCAGLHRLASGHTLITNWVGHGHVGERPHVVELDQQGHLVWTFGDTEHMKSISSLQVLEEGEGEPLH
jgi:hypothetical protein